MGDAGTPENFEIRYRLNRDSDWSISPSSKTSYHAGSNANVHQYYHRVENLIRLEDYVAQVRECIGETCSEWASHAFRTEKPIPPAPDSVRIVEVGSDFFELEWDPVPGAYNYDVNYRGGGSITSGGSNDTRYETVFDLTPGTRYTVTVNSCNDLQRHGDYGEQACGLLSAGTTITVTTESDIASPVLWPSWNGETWIVLSWVPEENDSVGDAGTPENFEIRYRLNRDSDWSISPSSKTSYHAGSNANVHQYYHRVENLIRLEDYVAQVRECIGETCSEWASHAFRTEKPIPPAPDSVRIVEVGSDFFVLEWDPVPGAYNYDVNYRGGGSITSGGSNDTRYETVFDLTPGTRYTVTVNSCNDLQRHGDYGEQACGLLSAGTTITVTTLE